MLNKYKSLLNDYGINTPLRTAHFMAQIQHESNLKPVSENLNYSAEGLCKTFPRYFPVLAKAKQYERQPSLIANRVYASRMGNGNEASGDGWKYRGRGFIQLTGKDNYRALSKDTRTDYVGNPEWLLKEADAMVAACWFWKRNGCNEIADRDDVVALTKRINGGVNGLEHRKALLESWKAKLM